MRMDLIDSWRGEVVDNYVDSHSSRFYHRLLGEKVEYANMLEVENDLAWI